MVNTDPKSRSHLTEIKSYFIGEDDQGGLRSYLIRGTAGVFALQIIATGLGFATNILLARILGATEYGVYSYVIAWLGLLTVFSMFGFGRLLVREIASYLTRKEWGLINGILRYIGTRSFLIAICVAIITGVVTWIFKSNLNPQMFPAFWIALVILPFLTLSNLIDQALQGFKRVILGRMPQILIRAPLFIVLIVLVYWLNPQNFDAVAAVNLSLVAVIAAFLVAVWLLSKNIPNQVKRDTPAYQQKTWLRSALPLLMVAGLFEINSRAPVIMLGTLAEPKDAGIFAVATLITGLISFILLSANAALGPVVSSLYTSDEMKRLQKIITRSARVTFVIALAVAFVLIATRQWILLLFGQEFQQSGTVLIILTIGQLVSVAAGSVGLLLVMTGHERNTLVAIAISSVATVILNAILIPRWGIEGAAVATTTSMILWNIILITQVRRRLGIDPTMLGILGFQGNLE